MNLFEILVECWNSFSAARKHKFLIVFTRSRQKIVILTRTLLHCINLVIKIPQDFNYLLQKLIPSSTRDLKTSKNASNSQTQQTPPLKSQILFLHFSPWNGNLSTANASNTIRLKVRLSQTRAFLDTWDHLTPRCELFSIKFQTQVGSFLTLTVLDGVRVVDAVAVRVSVPICVTSRTVKRGCAAGPRSPAVRVSICDRRLSTERSINTSRRWTSIFDLFRVRIVGVSVEAASD